MTLDDTVAMMRLMDRIREQIGVRYPVELQDDPAGGGLAGPAGGASGQDPDGRRAGGPTG
jgi:hypothetical protein